MNTKHNPGTPDKEVSSVRLCGRETYRKRPHDRKFAERQTLFIAAPSHNDFWLGWYDERLKRWYERDSQATPD